MSQSCTTKPNSLLGVIAVTAIAALACDPELGAESDAPPTGPRASASDHLDSCEWNVQAGNGTTVLAQCASYNRPIAGYCEGGWTGSTHRLIEASFPYEGSAGTDLIEDGEAWYDATGPAGWACRFGGAVTLPNEHTAYALCCGSSP
jgi:hypothetical protein